MTKYRPMALAAIALGCCISVFMGLGISRNLASGRLTDFKGIYYPARCLLEGKDPYKDGEILRVYEADGGQYPADPEQSRIVRRSLGTAVNLPTTFVLAAPFALLPESIAGAIWAALVVASFTFAAWLMWKLAEPYAPGVAALFLAFLLGGNEILFAAGNTAGLVIGLCGIASWCLIEERFLWAGTLCMGLSLAIKPHDTGLIWLYFLLAGGMQRRRSLQALAVATAIYLVMVVWLSLVAPHWATEMKENLAIINARGDLNDPGPTGLSKHSADPVVDLQAALSIFRDDPQFYNEIGYLVGGILILPWAVRAARSLPSRRSRLIGVAAAAALSMLPFYHRIHDAKLLLLTVPAFALTWSAGGAAKWAALVFESLAVLFISDVAMALFLIATRDIHPAASGFAGQFLEMLLTRPAPIALLLVALFYLHAFLRRGKSNENPRIAEATL